MSLFVTMIKSAKQKKISNPDPMLQYLMMASGDHTHHHPHYCHGHQIGVSTPVVRDNSNQQVFISSQMSINTKSSACIYIPT